MRPDELTTDVGSIVDGEEAVRIGLIDEVGGLDAALSALKGMIGEETAQPPSTNIGIAIEAVLTIIRCSEHL